MADNRDVDLRGGTFMLALFIALAQIGQCTATDNHIKEVSQQAQAQKRTADALEKIADQLQLQRIDERGRDR